MEDQARRMAASLRHRGPDGSGVWVDALSGVGVGHQRLSIIDLSENGAQPMLSGNGRYVIAYNGEIYNYSALRAELERKGQSFRGHSDTEVLVEGFVCWGVKETLRRLTGMFAIAVWDKQRRVMTLIRDRLGVKPLYWSYQDGLLLFGSELRALRQFDGWRPVINPAAAGDMAVHSCIAAPYTIYHGVFQLLPGALLTLDANGETRQETYWNLTRIAQSGQGAKVPDTQETVKEVEALLKDAVRCRMVADVNLGAFLSGGVDSSLVVALMQAQSASKVRTYTIGFSDDRLNEAPYARQVADILGTDHTEHVFRDSDALELVPGLAEIHDEPFGDSSQMPSHLLACLTRKHVKVALSGDGGDELFAGYDRYAVFDRAWRALDLLPAGGRRGLARAIQTLPMRRWDRIGEILPMRYRLNYPGERLYQLAEAMGAKDGLGFYQAMMRQGPSPERFLRHAPQPRITQAGPVSERGLLLQMQFNDMQVYLPDDILTKLDRTSMAAGLEVREPLLDHRLVELAWRLPVSMKIHGSRGKWILRRILGHYLPAHLIERPKAGFAAPLRQWLQGPLREWAEDLLNPQRLQAEGYFNAQGVREAWDRLQAGEGESPYLLWNILMFQAWLRRWHG